MCYPLLRYHDENNCHALHSVPHRFLYKHPGDDKQFQERQQYDFHKFLVVVSPVASQKVGY